MIAEIQREINKRGHAHELAQRHGNGAYVSGNQSFQRPEVEHSQHAPAHRAFQAQDAFVVEGLVAVIPPQAAEQPHHGDAGQVFQNRGQQHPRRKQQKQVVGEGPQQRRDDEGAEPVDDAEGPLHESPIQYQPFFLDGKHHAFHQVAEKAEEHKGMQDTVHIHSQNLNVKHRKPHPSRPVPACTL